MDQSKMELTIRKDTVITKMISRISSLRLIRSQSCQLRRNPRKEYQLRQRLSKEKPKLRSRLMEKNKIKKMMQDHLLKTLYQDKRPLVKFKNPRMHKLLKTNFSSTVDQAWKLKVSEQKHRTNKITKLEIRAQ
jgi:hypothetical protein